jgi:hypothetical protein
VARNKRLMGRSGPGMIDRCRSATAQADAGPENALPSSIFAKQLGALRELLLAARATPDIRIYL